MGRRHRSVGNRIFKIIEIAKATSPCLEIGTGRPNIHRIYIDARMVADNRGIAMGPASSKQFRPAQIRLFGDKAHRALVLF